MHNRCQIQI